MNGNFLPVNSKSAGMADQSATVSQALKFR